MGSLLVALLKAPALLATQEAITQGQKRDRREEHRARRSNLIISCNDSLSSSLEIDRRQVALKNNNLYVKTDPTEQTLHPFSGYYLDYPVDSNQFVYEGLVSTITNVAPVLNWIYVDKDTYEVKYGVKADAHPNVTRPLDCTRQDRRLTLENWEGFVAVRVDEGEDRGMWKLYFDRDEDML